MRDNMDDLKDKNVLNANGRPLRTQDVPGAASRQHAERLLEEGRDGGANPANQDNKYSLNDDRRVKVLSPGALVAKRFFRNRLAIVGLSILVVMFLFSFLGGWISPYGEDELFYTETYQNKEYVGITENTEYRYLKLTDEYSTLLQAKTVLAIGQGGGTIENDGKSYDVVQEGDGLFSVYSGTTVIGAAYLDIVSAEDSSVTFSADFQYNALLAYANGGGTFTSEGQTYTVDSDGLIQQNGQSVAVASRYVVQSRTAGLVISNAFREALIEAVESDAAEFTFTDDNGQSSDYTLNYDPATGIWSCNQETLTRVLDTYADPSAQHLLGTDRNGMDMLTRLMYGGRVSLVIGFIVVIISGVLGIILGGISGYFGKWVDNLIMRIVDIFYCIPSMPVIIILGAAMDGMRVDPQIRMFYLMLILGFLGWPSIARMVRGQILSLREQEFMTATEACGISVSRRIFRHLIPNVIPQLIVICTMSLGSTIITESTLSFLGLGVKFPFASWGNIINDVSNSYVLTQYWFVWIPAGVCLMLTVLAFNFVGDGLRDAFDPRMKR